MASYKFKVIKGGKIIGEATTRAEAEAAAKKLGGHVAEVVAATTGRRGNPAGQPQPTAKGLTGGQYLLWLTAYGNAMTTRGVDKRQAMQSVRQFTADAIAGQPIRVTDDVKLAWSAVHFDGQPTPAALRAGARAAMKPLIESEKTRNPPLEPRNAAILLDTVKPGKPQVIHGVKVSRVGSGYSIDRVVLSRELAIKRLEQGGKTANPKAERAAKTCNPNRERKYYIVKAVLADGDTINTPVTATMDELQAWYPVGGAIQREFRRPTTIKSVKFVEHKDPYPNPKASGRRAGGLLPHAAPYAGKEQIEYYNEQADIAEAAGDVESQRTALRNMIAAAKKFGATLDAQIAQSLLDDTYKSHSPKANPKTAKASGRKIQYV